MPKDQRPARRDAPSGAGSESESARGAAARMLRILDAFDHEFTSGTVKELAARTGIPPSSLFRLVRRLGEAGMLIHDGTDGHVAPGLKLIELGDIALRRLRVPDVVQGTLDDLQRSVGENASLSIWRGGRTRTCVAVSHSTNALREFTAVGETYDVWLGAAGKCIVAILPEDVRLLVIPDDERERRPSLLAEIDQVRERGFAVTESERVPGVTAVAAPVHDGRSWIGSLAVSGPSFRMTPKVTTLVSAVQASARDLSAVLATFR